MEFKFTKSEIAARKVFEECGLDFPTELPISQIILGRKAFYDEQPLSGKEGEIISVDGKSIITVNSNISFPTKKRFVAAHELGHHEMHKGLFPIISDTEYDLLSWYHGGPHEIEANEFAAEFLMPSELFYDEVKRRKFGPEVIDYLSTKFQVSKTAAVLRFVKRGNYPVFVVCCRDNKMKWFKKSDDWWHYSLFEKDQPPPFGTVAYEVFTKGTHYRKEELKQDIWKFDWFKPKNDDDPDKRFYEYCLFVPAYNYSLSVIWED